jgi:hypothetical protein
VHLILALLCVLAHASGPVLAKVVDISDTGYILQIGKETVPVCDSAKTKFWAKKKIAQRGDFTKDMSVWVRIKGDTTPGFLREIVDEESQKWLDSIRKTVVVGEFRKLDDKYATFAFSDGTEFSYRCTEKSKLTILGKDGSFKSPRYPSSIKRSCLTSIRWQNSGLSMISTGHYLGWELRRKGKCRQLKNKLFFN